MYRILSMIIIAALQISCSATPAPAIEDPEKAATVTAALADIQSRRAKIRGLVSIMHRDYNAMSADDQRFYGEHRDSIQREYERASGSANAYVDYILTNLFARGLDQATLEDLGKQVIKNASGFITIYAKNVAHNPDEFLNYSIGPEPDPIEAQKMLDVAIRAIAQEALSYWKAASEANAAEKQRLANDLERYRWESFDEIPPATGAPADWPRKGATRIFFVPRGSLVP